MEKDFFKLGDHNSLCDICGFKYKASALKKRWDGAICCHKDWEPRHPQDLIKSVSERQYVQDARPEPEYRFLSANEIQSSDL